MCGVNIGVQAVERRGGVEVESGRGKDEAWRAAEMCEEKRPSKMNTTRESDDETEMRTADLEAEVDVT